MIYRRLEVPVKKPTPDCYWVIPDRFLAGEYPSAPAEMQARAKARQFIHAGIDTFIDITEAGEHGLRAYFPYMQAVAANLGREMVYKRFSIPDLDIPEPAYLRSILKTLQDYLDDGRNVYLHCYGGIGRTGTVVGCYLVEQGMDGLTALRQIADWRQGTPDGSKPSPETDEQKDLILNWKKSNE